MTGNMQDASVADSIIKGIEGFNHDDAYRAIIDDAFHVFPEGRLQGHRKGLAEYIQVLAGWLGGAMLKAICCSWGTCLSGKV